MDNKIPNVSVLLCVFNGGNSLAIAIESILNQTYQDFEFIIIDDGSTDDSWEVIESYSVKDPRIRAFRQENIGLTKSLNRGLEFCKGEFIARQDADDISDVHRLELQVASAEHYDFIFARSYKLQKVVPNVFLLYFSADILLFTGNVFIHGTLFIRAKLLKKYQYGQSYKYAQDFDLYIRLIKGGHIPLIIPTPLYTLGVSEDQISKKNVLQQSQYVLKSMKENAIDTKYYSLMLKVRTGFLRNILRFIIISYLSIKSKAR